MSLPTREQVIRLPDGDGLILYDNVPPGWQAGGRIAFLVHGLTGSAESPGITRLAARLLARGLRTVRMDLRGAGKGLPLARATVPRRAIRRRAGRPWRKSTAGVRIRPSHWSAFRWAARWC